MLTSCHGMYPKHSLMMLLLTMLQVKAKDLELQLAELKHRQVSWRHGLLCTSRMKLDHSCL